MLDAKFGEPVLKNIGIFKLNLFDFQMTKCIAFFLGGQSGLVVTKLDSHWKGCGFKYHLIQYTIWKWGQSHANLPRAIPVPNSGLL